MSDGLKLGTCCVCGGTDQVRNVCQLEQRAPIPGRGGWGCFVCGLPMEGAVAVLCDKCFDLVAAKKAEIKFAVAGYPAENKRVPISSLRGEHKHDMSKHNEFERRELQRSVDHFAV